MGPIGLTAERPVKRDSFHPVEQFQYQNDRGNTKDEGTYMRVISDVVRAWGEGVFLMTGGSPSNPS